MAKKIFWSIFSLALVLTAAGCGVKKEAALQTVPPATQGEVISGSIKDLVKLGKSIKCDLTKENASLVSGVAYISGNKARSDFEVKENASASETIAGHFIFDGDTIYSWTDANKAQAVKISVADLEKQGAKLQQSGNGGAGNYNNKMDYRCASWSPDVSLFVPPSDVKFTDFSEFIGQFQNQIRANLPTQNLNTQAFCGTCDKMPTVAAKAQCRQSLGCK